MFFKDIVQPLIERGVPVIPLKPRTKIAFSPNWPNLATIDPAQISRWDTEYPSANCAAVAKAEPGGVWFFEIDDPALWARIQKETGQTFPKTFIVRSRPGRGHVYWRHSAASIELAQAKAYYSIKDSAGKEQCSARLNHAYVAGPGSVHPDTGLVYEVRSTAPIIEAPQWLTDWIKKNSTEGEKLPLTARLDGPKIPRGSHDNELTRIAGKLRQDGLEENTIAAALIEICEKRCEDYGSDYQEMCHKIAHSVQRYAIVDTRLFHNGVPVESAGLGTPQTQTAPETSIEPEDAVKKAPLKHPEFPTWVMNDTSIYENFVKPYCDQNCRYPEFMFMPAMVLLLNYLGTKVHISGKQSLPLSIYMVLIGRKGKLFKSASVRDAMEYFRLMGLLEHGSPNVRVADSKTLVWSAGSPEGFLIGVHAANCKNAVLFYDELVTLVNKAGIDSSAMIGNLLTAYEGGKLQNAVKERKNNYSFEPLTYCISLLTCVTDQDFRKRWSRLAGDDNGFDDRFFFLFQPQTFLPMTPLEDVNFAEGALKTRALIDKAVQQGLYKITDSSPLRSVMNSNDANHSVCVGRWGKVNGRCEQRAEKWALAFAVDMGRDEIDEECIEKGLALAKYELEVKNWLKVFEAETREARNQQEAMYWIERYGGVIEKRLLERLMHVERIGTYQWSMAYKGMVLAGWIKETGTGVKGDPIIVHQLIQIEQEEE
jgi:Bifunctional DNA primase/polymerase, N-terminal